MNRAQARVYRHAVNCRKLPLTLRNKARKARAATAPSKKLKLMKERRAAGKGEVSEDDLPNNAVTRMAKEGVRLSRAERHEQARLDILYLFCVGGGPMTLANRAIFKQSYRDLDPTFNPPTATALSEDLVIAEQQAIMEEQIEELRMAEDITLSTDGGTSHGGEAFWTVHASTTDRVVRLVECQEATDVSHTAEWISNLVLSVSVLFPFSVRFSWLTSFMSRLQTKSDAVAYQALFAIAPAIHDAVEHSLSLQFQHVSKCLIFPTTAAAQSRTLRRSGISKIL